MSAGAWDAMIAAELEDDEADPYEVPLSALSRAVDAFVEALEASDGRPRHGG